MLNFNFKVIKMTQNNSAPNAVFKRFDGFYVSSLQRNAGAFRGNTVEINMERDGVRVSVFGPAEEVDKLISIKPAKYWDGGHDPVIGQEFLSNKTGRAYTVAFPVYHEGILTGCYGYSKESKGSFFFSIADMLPGREPLTAVQLTAIDEIIEMRGKDWITQEQSDDMIAIIKKSTKS